MEGIKWESTLPENMKSKSFLREQESSAEPFGDRLAGTPQEEHRDEPSEAPVEDVLIEQRLNIPQGQTVRYRNKNITVCSKIVCEGTLVLEHCTVQYGENGTSYGIALSGEASLKATDSLFICSGFTKDTYFIGGDGNFRENNEFENCTFRDCSYFLHRVNVSFQNCTVQNSGIHFAADIRTLNADGMKVNNDCIADFTYRYLKRLFEESNARDDLDFLWGMDNSTDFRFIEAGHHISLTNVELTVSERYAAQLNEFSEGKHPLEFFCFDFDIFGSTDVKVEACTFINCRNIFVIGKNTSIRHCKFINCEENLIDARRHYGTGAEISFCEFRNCTNRQKKPMMFFFADKDNGGNKMHDCVFENITVCDGAMIAVDILEKPRGFPLEIADCDFKNCTVKGGTLIETSDQYYGAFSNKHEVRTVYFSNCTGIDDID